MAVMLISVLKIVIGFGLLSYGADRFVTGASATASNLGVSPLLIGLTIVGFGTSAPEMLVAAVASLNETPELAVGNAVGSNITNIALVLGATAIIAPLAVDSKILRKEFPVMLLAMVLAVGLMFDRELSRSDGLILSIGAVALMGFLIWLGLKSSGSDRLAEEFEQEAVAGVPMSRALLALLLGLGLLLVGSNLLVSGATAIAVTLGVSELIIGLTIVAIGTSLPELAASAASALKGEPEIAIGNVIGSNMFNMLAVLPLPGLIYPGPLQDAVVTRDCAVMLGLTVAMLVMSFGFRGPGHINRLEGALLLVCFCGYQWILYLSVTG